MKVQQLWTGWKKNKKEARRWFTVAAEAGMTEAADLLKTL